MKISAKILGSLPSAISYLDNLLCSDYVDRRISKNWKIQFHSWTIKFKLFPGELIIALVQTS